MPENQDDDDIIIDFSKLKSMFKKNKEHAKKKTNKEDHEKTHKNLHSDKEEKKKEEKDSDKEEDKIEEGKKEKNKETPLDSGKNIMDEESDKINSEDKKPKEDNKEKEKEDKEEKDSDNEEEDEISIDFSKIKGFFKPKKEQDKKETEDEEEINIDWKKIADFGKKYSVLLLILIPIILSLFLRLQPASLPATDKWAEDAVMNHYRGQIANEINKKYPNLPQQNKNSLISNQFAEFLKANQGAIEQQIDLTSQQFKARLQDDTGQTYLLAIDPYFWERLTRNVVDHGNPGDVEIDGVWYDNHMMAPNGREMPKDMLHAYVQAIMYYVVSAFNPDVTVKNVAFFSPVFLATLAIIPAFFIGRRIAGNVGGLFAGTLLAVHGQFITRTAAGFADTDSYSVMLPLFIIWTFLEAFHTKEKWKQISLISLSGFFVGLFSFSWTGAWYIFDIVLASIGVYLFYLGIDHVIKNGWKILDFFKKPLIKNILLILILFIVVSAIFVTIFRDYDTFTSSFIKGPLGFKEFKSVAKNTAWPNVYTTVAEQNSSSLTAVINNMGGKVLFILAIIGALLTIFKKDKQGNRDLKLAAIIIIWMAVSTYAAIKGVRFSLLIVPPFAVGFGLFVGLVFQYVKGWAVKELNIDKKLASGILIIAFGLLLMAPYNNGLNVAKNEVPSMNDAWYNSLEKIKQNSPENAIINSWWDFGHWFKNIADRPVTFDGTSQNTPQAHWIGKVLLTDNEKEAVGILRMLDCGGNNAFDEVNRITNNPIVSIKLLHRIIQESDRNKADRMLQKTGLNKEQSSAILKYTHCEAPQNYFIASEDMIGKSGVWAHFGSWNFTKATMYKDVNSMNPEEGISYLKDNFDLTDDSAEDIYYDIQTADPNQWIAPWPSYASGLSGCSDDGDILSCANGIRINMSGKEYSAYVETPGGRLYPKVFAYPGKEDMIKVTHEGDSVIKTREGRELGVTLVPQGDSYSIILLSPELAASIFTRLFFLDAHGLKHFSLFSEENSITGGKIYVYNVSWNPGELQLKKELRPKTEVNEGDTVLINYIGYTSDGNIFDTTIRDPALKKDNINAEFDEYNESLNPFSFVVGEGTVIKGMDSQIRGMKIGEEKTMTISPEEGYGTDPSVHPLGNKTLKFRVRVESIS